MDKNKFVIGIDYGTDSVRALLINALTGGELAVSVFEYPRWKSGLYSDALRNQFRQHPLDYIEGLEFVVRDILKKHPQAASHVKAISIDTTGSTPAPVNSEGLPLALLPQFAENPDAMFILWKDHTAVNEAGEINALAHTWGGDDYTKYSGGTYSSEWFWAKALHITRVNREIAQSAYSWVEHSDWIPALLCGKTNPGTLERNRCSAGHKAMWNKEWNGFPSKEFFGRLDPVLSKVRERMNDSTLTGDKALGALSEEWAGRLGLDTSVIIGVGAIDAHFGAVGGEIKPYCLNKVIGTSTCDMLIVPNDKMKNILVHGICGQVDGSIIPGMQGMEAGQSAFGDIYAWFKKVLLWPLQNIAIMSGEKDVHKELQKKISENILIALSEQAGKIPVGESGIIALDWLNGRRTPDANQSLRGAITGLNLASDAPGIYRALVEAAAFGAKAIVERFISEGIEIRGITALGGVAQKSPFVMQVLADVLGMPIEVVRSEQTCALGACMFASVVAGIYPDITVAQKKLGKGMLTKYAPDKQNQKKYIEMYNKYLKLGAFYN